MAAIALYVGQQIATAFIANAVMQAIMPAQKAEGPRITDKKIQTSNEGVVQPVLMGINRVAGQLIDGKAEFDEVSTTENQGGKGGGGVDVTSYSYYATVAVRLCRVMPGQRVVGIRRMWADDKLIFDIGAAATETGTEMTGLFRRAVELAAEASVQFKGVTFYDGTQTEPDPTLEGIHGVGNVPAYRNQCYVVFDRFNCTKYGRFPNISAEVVTSGGYVDVVDTYSIPNTGYTFQPQVPHASIDAMRAVLYASDGALTQRNSDGSTATITTGVGKVLDSRGDEILTSSSAADIEVRDAATGAVRRWLNFGNPDEFLLCATYGRDGDIYLLSAWGVWPTGYARRTEYAVRRWAPSGATASVALGSSYDSNRDVALAMVYDAQSGRLIVGRGDGVNVIDGSTLATTFLPLPGLTSGVIYLVRSMAADAGRAVILADTAWAPQATRLFELSFGSSTTCTLKQTWANCAAGGVALADGVAHALTWDRTAGRAVLHSVDLADNDDSQRTIGELTPTDVQRFTTSYARSTDTLRAAGFDVRLARMQPEAVSLAGVVAALVAEPGIDAGDIVFDMPAAAPSVLGYQRSSVMSARDALAPLCAAYAFDVIDVGHAIKVRARGGAPVATIHEDELLQLEGNDSAVIEVQLAQDSELPSALNLAYIDRSQEYAPGNQPSRRRLTGSTNVVSQELPIVFDGNTQPRHIADQLLTASRLAARTYKFVAPFDYVNLEPGDPIVLALRDGTTRLVLLTRVELSIDALAVFCEASAYDPSIYGSLPPQVEAPGRPTVAVKTNTRLQLLQLPALSDTDATAPVLYAAAAPYVAGGWQGTGLYRSIDDGNTWAFQQALAQSTIGVCATALPAGRQACYTDLTSTLRVVLPYGGTLASTTKAQLLAGANAAAVVRADGEVEVIQWLTATLQADGSYVLSGLLNGRLGTEHVMDGHAAGEMFVLLQSSAVARLVLDAAELGAERQWKPVVAGGSVTTGLAQVLRVSGRNLKPYAPVRLRGTRDGAGNLTISWTRRSRLRGTWRTGNWAPLGEASESYVVEVLDGAGAVKRTLTASTPSVVYTAAQQVADFGSVKGVVATRVYQVSADVGRGIPAGASL